MAVANPYAEDLGSRDPLQALAETPGLIQKIVAGWNAADFERSYAPGKWSARKILVHLAQAELALAGRARFALTQSGYVAQPFSQDDWMRIDQQTDAETALGAYLALRRFNLAMWRALTADQRKRPFQHPEYGELTVEWIMVHMAGHDIHHHRQFALIR